jgi:peptidoglycan/LPS O-acetylase OafA/YrhL
LVIVWAVGVLIALFVPALFVAPTAKNPPTGDVWLAFGSTLVGSAVMIGAATALWRRKADSSVLLMGLVPAVACVAGGVILAASKLAGA